MDVLLDSPAIEEEADGEDDTARHSHGRAQANFGSVTQALVLVSLDNVVGESAKSSDTDNHTDTGRKKSQADSSLVESVVVLEDERERRDEKVQNTVGDSNVESHKGDDGGSEEKLQRADDGKLELVRNLGLGLKLAAEVLIASLLAQTLSLLLKKNRGEGLLHQEP